MRKIYPQRNKHKQGVQFDNSLIFVEGRLIKISLPVFHFGVVLIKPRFFTANARNNLYKIFRRLACHIPQHHGIVIKFMYIVVLHILIIKSINNPNKDAGYKLDIKQRQRNNRLKIFKLQLPVSRNKEVEEEEVKKSNQYFFYHGFSKLKEFSTTISGLLI